LNDWGNEENDAYMHIGTNFQAMPHMPHSRKHSTPGKMTSMRSRLRIKSSLEIQKLGNISGSTKRLALAGKGNANNF